jgi:hypothetical protein
MQSQNRLREHLIAALDALDQAHDTHIYSECDEHPADCYYCAVVRRGRAALDRTPPRRRNRPNYEPAKP